MRRVLFSLAAVTAAAALAPSTALAQSNDPSVGSPSGTIYEIPLDSARNDAAPRTRGGGSSPSPTGGQGAGAGSSASSPIHSDNGFGSSSQVPGASGGGGGSGSNGTGGGGGGGGGAGTSGKGSAGADSARVPQTASEALISPTAQAAAPSSTRAYILLGLAALVAVALGIASRLAARRR
jgi:hypothetical protein